MAMERKIIDTGDGSSSLYDPATGDNFHSFHGAETESQYVFIEKGLALFNDATIKPNILEVGLGTGLNCLLTYQYLIDYDMKGVLYTALEPIPVEREIIKELKFRALENPELKEFFDEMHGAEWNQVKETARMDLKKIRQSLQECDLESGFNLVYYDAFGPTYQPEMWGKDIINKVCSLLAEDGILVSYCAQGQFRRNLQESGMRVERLPGPPGKREMIRAIKIRD